MANSPSAQLAAETSKAADDTKSETAQTTSSSGLKRKRGTELKFYAVRAGHRPGIYHSWEDCKAQVFKAKNPICKCDNMLIVCFVCVHYRFVYDTKRALPRLN
jgi:hypothetical protein